MGSRWSRCATQSCRSPFRFVPCRSWIGGWKVVVHRLRTSREVSMFRCHPSSTTSTTTTMSTASIQVVRSLPYAYNARLPERANVKVGRISTPSCFFPCPIKLSSAFAALRADDGVKGGSRLPRQVRGSPRRQRSRGMLSALPRSGAES